MKFISQIFDCYILMNNLHIMTNKFKKGDEKNDNRII
jgi:hypothetical protein